MESTIESVSANSTEIVPPKSHVLNSTINQDILRIKKNIDQIYLCPLKFNLWVYNQGCGVVEGLFGMNFMVCMFILHLRVQTYVHSGHKSNWFHWN